MTMPTLEDLAKHSGQLLSLAALLSLIIPQWRAKIGAFFSRIRQWLAKDRLRFQEVALTHMADVKDRIAEARKERAEFMTRYLTDSKRWDGGLEELSEIKSILQNGVSHKLALLAAQHRQALELEARPIFVCDEHGKNMLSSQGYLNLLGLVDHEDLSSVQWQMSLYGELREQYMADFGMAQKERITLKSVCDFQNPDTGEHRGRWRVIAPCVAVNAALVFTGRFIPVDERAHEIARQFHWL